MALGLAVGVAMVMPAARAVLEASPEGFVGDP